MNIEWNKVVTQAITALVVAVFLGAATIVWKGATSVDDKVQNTREDMTYLITSLSDKLAGYEVQLTSLSNQITIVICNQSNLILNVSKPTFSPVTGTSPKVGTELVIPIKKLTPEPENQMFQQKAYSQDIMRQLKR